MVAMMLPSELPLVGVAAMSPADLPGALVLGCAAVYRVTPLERRCPNICSRAAAVALGVGAVAWIL